MAKKHKIERLLKQAVYDGVIKLRCSKGHTVLCEPDGEYCCCQVCGERVENPLVKQGLI